MSFALYNPTRRIFRHRIRLEQNIYIAILSIIALILAENRVIVFGFGLVCNGYGYKYNISTAYLLYYLQHRKIEKFIQPGNRNFSPLLHVEYI